MFRQPSSTAAAPTTPFEVLKPVHFDNQSIRPIAHHPTKLWLAVPLGNTIKLLNSQTGQPLQAPWQQLTTQEADTACTVLSANGKVLAIRGKSLIEDDEDESEKKITEVWDFEQGKLLNTFKDDEDGYYTLAISSDGQIVATTMDDKTRDGKTQLWDTHSGASVHTFPYAGSMAFSPNGQWFAIGTDDGIQLFSTANWTLVGTVLTGDKWEAARIFFSPDSRYLASTNTKAGTIRLWHVPQGQLHKVLPADSKHVRTLAFSPNGRYLVSAGKDKIIRLWDVQSGNFLGSFEHRDEDNFYILHSVTFSHDGQRVISCDGDKLRFWDVSPALKAAPAVTFPPPPAPLKATPTAPANNTAAMQAAIGKAMVAMSAQIKALAAQAKQQQTTQHQINTATQAQLDEHAMKLRVLQEWQKYIQQFLDPQIAHAEDLARIKQDEKLFKFYKALLRDLSVAYIGAMAALNESVEVSMQSVNVVSGLVKSVATLSEMMPIFGSFAAPAAAIIKNVGENLTRKNADKLTKIEPNILDMLKHFERIALAFTYGNAAAIQDKTGKKQAGLLGFAKDVWSLLVQYDHHHDPIAQLAETYAAKILDFLLLLDENEKNLTSDALVERCIEAGLGKDHANIIAAAKRKLQNTLEGKATFNVVPTAVEVAMAQMQESAKKVETSAELKLRAANARLAEMERREAERAAKDAENAARLQRLEAMLLGASAASTTALPPPAKLQPFSRNMAAATGAGAPPVLAPKPDARIIARDLPPATRPRMASPPRG